MYMNMLDLSNMSAPAERQKQFKKGIDSEESRRRREDTTIQIRKSKKEERLNQRRRMVSLTIVYACSKKLTPRLDSRR